MKVRDLEALLLEHPFFDGLPDEDVRLIAGCGRNEVFKEGAFLMRQGEAANSFFVIRHGLVTIEIPAASRGSIVIGTEGPGEVVGWSWILPPHRWQYDVRARELSRVITLDGACLRGKCDADPRLGYEMMKRFSRVMTERLHATRLQLTDLYGQHGDEP